MCPRLIDKKFTLRKKMTVKGLLAYNSKIFCTKHLICCKQLNQDVQGVSKNKIAKNLTIGQNNYYQEKTNFYFLCLRGYNLLGMSHV